MRSGQSLLEHSGYPWCGTYSYSPSAICEVAQKAKEIGAWLVIVHGETSVEPVEKSTNLAAVQSPYIDILAHPGLIIPEGTTLAAQNDIYIELSARMGHSAANAHIALISQKAKTKLLVNSEPVMKLTY